MANLVAVLATTHHPFFYRASTAPPESRPDFADEWVRKVVAYRETLTRANPEVLVMVGSDHFHQLFLDNMPQFLIGKAPFYDANYYNEEREFGLPRMRLKGHEELSAYLLRAGLDAGFDFAFSNELRVDHSITCPIITTRPQADLPIVPIYTNIFAPPLPQPWRFVQLGRMLRRLVEAWPSPSASSRHRHRSSLPRAWRSPPVWPARPGSGVRPQGRRLDQKRRYRRSAEGGDAR